MATIDFVTPCMGRLPFLRRTLPLIVAQPHSTCTVVDYSCPERTGDWVEANFPAVRVRVTGRTTYTPGLAKNSGARGGSGSPWLCFIDCDILLDPTFVESLLPSLEPHCFYRFQPTHDLGLTGTFLCPRAGYERADGFDEVMRNYGDDDLDIFEKLQVVGFTERVLPASLLTHLPHGDDLRTRYQDVKDIRQATLVNRFYRLTKNDFLRLVGPPLDLAIRQTLYQSAVDTVAKSRSTGAVSEINCVYRKGEFFPGGWGLQRSVRFQLLPPTSHAEPTPAPAANDAAPVSNESTPAREAVAAGSGAEAEPPGDSVETAHISFEGRETVVLRYPKSDSMDFALQEIFGKKDYPFLSFLEPEAAAIIDVGANVGFASAWFALLYPGKTVYAFEPGQEAFGFLQENARQFPNVRPFHCGWFDRDAEADLFLGGAPCHHSMGQSPLASPRKERIQVRRASAVIADLGVERIAILKVDTEGAELAIFRDLEPLLDRVDSIFLEYHSEADRVEIERLLTPRFMMFSGRMLHPHRGAFGYVAKEVIARRTRWDDSKILPPAF